MKRIVGVLKIIVRNGVHNMSYDMNITTNNFYLFRSMIQHKIRSSELKFIQKFVSENYIENYFEKGEYLKCVYSLVCLDMLCEKYEIPLCVEYNYYRQIVFEEPIYLSQSHKLENYDYMPEFKRHNIYEISIYDVC